MTDIFIPSKVKVGFSTPWDQGNQRWGFNDSILCHVAHYNRKGTLNGAKRFNQARQASYQTIEDSNEPQSGFSIGHRHTDVDNDEKSGGIWVMRPDNSYLHLGNSATSLLLANAEISQGAIKNKCVMGWSDGSVYLLPVDSPAYAQACTYTEIQHANISNKDLIPGGIYVRKFDSKTAIYLGRHDLTNIVGHAESAVNKTLRQRNIFYFEGVWQVMAADSLYKKSGDVSDADLAQLLSKYKDHQQRTKLGEIIFSDPDFKGMIDRMGSRLFELDFAIEVDGKYCKVANMRIDEARSYVTNRAGLTFKKEKGVYNGQNFENLEFTLPPFQDLFLKNLAKDSFEELITLRKHSTTDEYLSSLEEKMKLIGIKMIYRKVGNDILPLSAPGSNSLEGILTGIDPKENSWALC